MRLRRRQHRRVGSKIRFSSPFLTWTHAKHSTPVRSFQHSNWTRFGTFHATCTYNALCLLLFTYAGHHNNSFAKCCFNRTVIWFATVRWTCLAQLVGHLRCNTAFLTFVFVTFIFVFWRSILLWWSSNQLRNRPQHHRDEQVWTRSGRSPDPLPALENVCTVAKCLELRSLFGPSNSPKNLFNWAPPALLLGFAFSKQRLRRNNYNYTMSWRCITRFAMWLFRYFHLLVVIS